MIEKTRPDVLTLYAKFRAFPVSRNLSEAEKRRIGAVAPRKRKSWVETKILGRKRKFHCGAEGLKIYLNHHDLGLKKVVATI